MGLWRVVPFKFTLDSSWTEPVHWIVSFKFEFLLIFKQFYVKNRDRINLEILIINQLVSLPKFMVNNNWQDYTSTKKGKSQNKNFKLSVHESVTQASTTKPYNLAGLANPRPKTGISTASQNPFSEYVIDYGIIENREIRRARSWEYFAIPVRI